MKTCKRCSVEEPDDQFRPEHRTCRACYAAQHRQWRQENIDRVHEQEARYEQEHKAQRHERNIAYYTKHADVMRERARVYGREHRAERSAYARQWYHKNTERWNERNRAWLAANPDKAERKRKRDRERLAQWDKEHPDRERDKCAWRRAKTCMAATIERVKRADIWRRDGGRCHICGKPCDPNNWHLDHLIPLSIGGTHEPKNVAVSHPRCNMVRGNRGAAQLRLLGEV